MTFDWTNPDKNPPPERLAAFLDGDLAGPEHREIETWLGRHPEAAAQIDSWRRLDRLWQQAPPPEPPPAAWERTLERIEAGLPRPGPNGRPRRPWMTSGWFGLAGAAALLAFFLSPPNQKDQFSVQRVEEFPIATVADVNILSMEARDAGALVVGNPPIQGELNLASQGDVVMVRMEPFQGDGMVPTMVHAEGMAPMIIPPQITPGNK